VNPRPRWQTVCVWLCATASITAAAATGEAGTDRAVVTLNLAARRPIPAAFFGHNIEYIGQAQGLWDSATGHVREDLRRLLIPLRPGVLRFPGGTLSNYYHWADGIGPVAARGKGCPDWGNHEPELDMGFGTDEFFGFAADIGATATMITVNVPNASELKPWMGTPQEAAAWVAYCNAAVDSRAAIGVDARGRDWGTAGDWAGRRAANGHPQPYAVAYWELGNETFVGMQDPQVYAAACRQFAQAMKAVDGSIRIGIVGRDTDFGLRQSPWNSTVARETAGVADFFIAHFYLPGIAPGTVDATRITVTSAERFRRKLDDLRAEVSPLSLAVTEFACNLRLDSETDPATLAMIRSQQAVVYLADTLLALLAAGVEVSNYWTLRGWHWSLIELEGGRALPQGPYWAYRLVAEFRQAFFCPTAVECGRCLLDTGRATEFGGQEAQPALVAGASVNREGTRVAVMLVNRALERGTAVEVRLGEAAPGARAGVLYLLAAAPAAVNTLERPDAITLQSRPVGVRDPRRVTCELPPCSVGVLVLE
jgi:alpha-L-arabinofuranosidase